jgi:uncharacterized membrane protein YdbT with pleckstrin-like domain
VEQDRKSISSNRFDAASTTRPAPRLLKYYFLASLLTGPLFPIVLVPLFFKYETLRYRFDESGIAMSWGIIFRREIYLTYRRIQDIHLSKNIVQRWMGLATVGVQTASGSSGPEMSIEGILDAEGLRDFLYNRMRGVQDADGHSHASAGTASHPLPADEALSLLEEIRDQLRRIEKQGASREN